LELFSNGSYQLYMEGATQPAFCWGSDFDVLRRVLGTDFDNTFSESLLSVAFDRTFASLASYTEEGMVKRICPESNEPDFVPYVDDTFDPDKGMGFAYFATHHHGRRWPRHEIDFLTALAAVGYRKDECLDRACALLSLRKSVPADFTSFLSQDYSLLPETVHLYARSVGIGIVHWLRNYWFLTRLGQT
jgi:hypothetical protein